MKDHYARLCLILVATLLLGLPLREWGYSGGVIGVLSVAGVYGAARAASTRRGLRLVYLAALVPIVVISLWIAFLGGPDALAVLGMIIQLVFYAIAGMEILTRLARIERMTSDTLLGGIAVYLLIGFIFANVFGVLEIVRPGSFRENHEPLRPPPHPEFLVFRHPELSYFSFVTLTTVGFGDIVPSAPAARVFTALEAIIGQIYLTTFLAFLVGNYVSHRTVVVVQNPPPPASSEDDAGS